jgi:hypothetical protein
LIKRGAIMKKQTINNQTGQTNEVKADMQSANVVTNRRVMHNHKPTDHSHGRVNRHAIGVNHEPGLFH